MTIWMTHAGRGFGGVHAFSSVQEKVVYDLTLAVVEGIRGRVASARHKSLHAVC